MFHFRFGSIAIPQVENASAFVFLLIIVNLAFNILANSSFRISAMSATWCGILTWQVVGNLAGLITVITLTVLLRYLPLSVVFPLTTCLAVLGVQMVAAGWIFHEAISGRQWLGTLAVVAGIWLIKR